MTEEFKIEKDITMPTRANRYPWNKMEIGDSIFFTGKKVTQIYNTASGYGKRHGKNSHCERSKVAFVYGG
jgi:hypothetical protein